ncbi:putative proline-rich receptor-like protein kinase PERK11 [Acorus calamus]|uniref:Proline-rich receptor-like protein kinase PERK11 n=1 Tax=Acorus calamus TaxID=4465 RepID=A0AAV9D888_ACOCL|nr:putative proline-rich receptor-like protein kinase PERK11 [Acorus calamus]
MSLKSLIQFESETGTRVLRFKTAARKGFRDGSVKREYLAPEYIMYGKVSDKIDVYSFGVVPLELLTWRKPIDSENPKTYGDNILLVWATPLLEKGDIADILDPNLNGKFDEAQMQRMVLNLLKRDEDFNAPADSQAISLKELENHDEQAYPASDVQSHIGLAFLDVTT